MDIQKINFGQPKIPLFSPILLKGQQFILKRVKMLIKQHNYENFMMNWLCGMTKLI